MEDVGLYDYGARFYDPAIGKFTSVDALADDINQVDKSVYSYAWDNPVSLTDPDGNCPWCIGAIVGAAVDYAFQVGANLAQGKDLGEAMTDVDLKSIAISAASGAASGGISLLAKGKKVGTLGKAVLEMTVDTGESLAKQASQGDMSLSKTVTDVVSSTLGGKVKVDAPINTKGLNRQVDRTGRIAANDLTSSGRAATAKSAKNSLNRANNLNAAAQKGVQESTENSLQNTADGVRSLTPRSSLSQAVQMSTTARDNTRTTIQIIPDLKIKD